MLGIITMSFSRTYGATLPLATVETITLGVRVAAPCMARCNRGSSGTAEREARIRPSAVSRESVTAAAPAMASTIAPRSPRARSAARSTPPSAAQGVGADVGAALRVSQAARVHHQNAVPALANALRREGMFQPLRIERSEHGDRAHDRAPPDARPNASISSRPSPLRRGPSVRLANLVTSAVNAVSVGSRSSELAP